ncbi:Cadmium/zinc-transporting ATPase hma2 [Ancistrocladus abbreviatus]
MGRVGNERESEEKKWQKSYFEVLGLCCPSEVALIEKILRPMEGVKDISVIVPSKTVIVVHDNLVISPAEIGKALNQARLEASVKFKGQSNVGKKWPSPYVIACGSLLLLSFLKYAFKPFQWLAVAAVAVGIYPVLLRGIAAIRNFTLDVNILVLIAVAGTLALRDYWEAGSIIFLFTIAEWLESRAGHKATAVMSSLMSIAPQKATVEETREMVDVEDVKLNTILAIKAGDTIPIDGIVVQGNSEVDEKTLTGESLPVPKQKDSTVWAGTINLNGYLSVKTTALADECVVAKMATLVEDAQNRKSRTQRLIDKFAKYYTPAVVLMSAALAAIPAGLRVHHRNHWFHLALVVVVTACPCGLVLSTPVATFCALSQAATKGLLIKGGDFLEHLAKIKVAAFDKTGTVTSGDFTVTEFQSLSHDITINSLLYWVSSIESKSSHPIAAAIVSYGRSESIEPKPENVEAFQNFPGEGISGKIDGREIFVGNSKIAQRAGCLAAQNGEAIEKERRTLGYVYDRSALIGIFSLSDSCRSGVEDAVRELKSMGIRTAMLTGDNHAAALHAQEQLGNALDEIHAELLPEDKARIIQDYKNKVGPTAMVGDGVNDAPALATADVGISMGICGSSLATETGHVILMSNDIRKIPKAVQLAKKCIRKVRENVIISVTTKAAILAVAIAGHPLVWLAVLADVMTCLVVIFNSMLLLQGTREQRKKCFSFFSSGHTRADKVDCCPPSSRCSEIPKQCCSATVTTGTCPPGGGDVHCHTRDNNKCCSPSNFSSESRNQCCSKELAVHTHEKKKCCSSGNHSPEASDQSFSKKAAMQTCEPRCGSVDTHGNKNCCSTGCHSSETPKQCCSRERAVETCELSGRIIYAKDKKSCFSASSHSSEIPKSCCSKKIATQTNDPSSSIVQTDDSTKCCSASRHCSETPKQCCSKKVAVEICDPSGGAHSHLELIDDSTWKLGHCVMNDPHHGVCDDECHFLKRRRSIMN